MDNYKNREFLEPQEDGTYKHVDWTCLTCPPEDYVEIPEGADFYMEMLTGLKVGSKFFFKFDEEDLRVLTGSGWQHASYDSIQEYIDEGDHLLWSRETIRKDQGLISGADVPALLKKGQFVQYRTPPNGSFNGGDWKDLNLERDEEEFTLGDFINSRYEWRLKPTTLTVNAELPKPHKETQHNALVFAVTYEFKNREERNAFADKLRGNNS